MKRRSFLLSAAAASGALLVGWGMLPPRSRLGRADALPLAEALAGDTDAHLALPLGDELALQLALRALPHTGADAAGA